MKVGRVAGRRRRRWETLKKLPSVTCYLDEMEMLENLTSLTCFLDGIEILEIVRIVMNIT